MPKIQALREQRAALAKELRNQMDNKGDAVWSPEDKKAFDAKAEEIERIDDQIASMQRVLDLDAEKKFEDIPTIDPKNKMAAQKREAFVKMLRHGERALTAEEHALLRNTTSTTTPGEGGYTVQSDVATELIDLLKSYRGMRDVAQQITTSNGAPLSYSKSDGTSETGEIVAENTSATDEDPSFGTVPLNTVKFGSKVFTLPIELIQDSSVDIVALVNKRARDRIGRIQNTSFTTGSGSGAPFGLVTASTVRKTGASGQVTTILYDDLVDLVDSIDIAYDNGNLKFMFAQTMRKVVRKLKDTAGRPIWTPSYDAGIAGAFADQLLGYDVVINNAVAAPAASAKSLVFGDLNQYMIRDAMELTMFRFEDSAYLKKGQIGFLAWARAGGNLLDTGATGVYQHPAS
jgi:HK97 family phage major capsid protein